MRSAFQGAALRRSSRKPPATPAKASIANTNDSSSMQCIKRRRPCVSAASRTASARPALDAALPSKGTSSRWYMGYLYGGAVDVYVTTMTACFASAITLCTTEPSSMSATAPRPLEPSTIMSNLPSFAHATISCATWPVRISMS